MIYFTEQFGSVNGKAMDFDSPDVAKEFPGLYMGDAGKTLNDPADCKLI